MKKSFFVIDIKSMDDEQRVIRGIATTPEIDRMGDSIDPMGVKVSTDIPLFLYHDSTKVVGRARFGKATKDGIPFEARLPKIAEAGRLKERVDEAWQMLKYELIQCVSIGFNVLNEAYERLKETGGYLFSEIEVLELSLVPIPALPSAVITGIRSGEPPMRRKRVAEFIKSIDERHLAALGHQGLPPDRSQRPGASGQSKQAASGRLFHSRSQKGTIVKTLKELREERETKSARLKELVEILKADGHDATDEENDEFDALETEIKSLDLDIKVARFHSVNAGSATAIEGKSTEGASRSRGGISFVKRADPDDKFPGQSYVRGIIARAAAFASMKEGNYVSPADIAQHRWGKTHPSLVGYIKAAVAGGGTGSGEWGAELAASDARFTGDFIEFLYSMTVFDRLPLRSVPARVNIKGQDGAATGYWVGESKGIPVSKPDFSTVELTPLKVGAIAVCSKELVADSSPSAEMWIRDSIAQASAQRVDTTFLSSTAASAGVSPAGLLNGLSAYAPSGTDAAAVRADLMSLYTGFLTAKNASGLVQIMTPSMAKAISLMVNSLGQTEFPNLNANGGTLLGDTVYTGDNVTGGDWILLKPFDIWKIGDGGVEVSMSDTAMVEQDDAPQAATDTPVAASANLVSLWQEESIGFKVVRRINYAKRRTSAVAVLSNAEYGGVVS
jgi:HK97 family phage prohead protease